jgi:hypothetical protein
MRAIAANDRLPAIGEDGAVLALPPGATSPRMPGIAPVLAPLIDAARSAGEPSSTDAPLWVATPSHLPVEAMSDLLRELRQTGHAVQGFIDSAVVTEAWLQRSAPSITVEFCDRSCVISVVVREGGEYALRRSAALPVGARDLHEAWLRMLGDAMVLQWRFDPLEDPEHEQALRTALPGLLENAAATGGAHFTLPLPERELPLSLSRDQFQLAVHELLLPLGNALQALCAAMGDCEVRIAADAARWPGVPEVLSRAGSRPVLALAPGAAACAASLLPGAAAHGGAVQYLTRHAALAQQAPAGIATLLDTGVASFVEAPTHVVFGGRALAIDAEGLVLGRNPGAGRGALRLPEGIAGLSRRHCTLRRTGPDTVLIDHSQYGSFVDGMRVNGRTLLAAGSVLRLGTPGIELPLITLDRVAGG